MGQGIGQILVYAAVLHRPQLPARHLDGARLHPRDAATSSSAASSACSGATRPATRTGSSTASRWSSSRSPSASSCTGLLRLQGHLFLNPDHLPAVPWTVALNTTASFVTNTNWQYYAGEATMSYLSQMAGLAVQQFVSAGVGLAVVAAVIRGIARRGGGVGLGNFWRDLYRSIVYILLPLSIVLAVILISQGVPQTFHGHATATTLQGAHQTIARGPVGSMIAIKQLGTNGGGYYDSNSAVPFENPTPLSNFLEMLAILLIPFAQVVMFGRMVLARRHAWVLYAVCFAIFALGVSVAFPAEQHGSAVLRQSGVNITHSASQVGRKHDRQGDPLRHRQHRTLGDRDDRRLQRLGQRRTRRVHARRRSCALGQHVPRRGRAGRRRLGALRPDLLRPDRRLRRRV